MPFAGGERLREAYRAARAGGYAFMASNVAEPNVLIGLLDAYVEARSDLIVQISPSAARFAGGGDLSAGLRGLSRMIHELSRDLPIDVFINLDHFTIGEIDVIGEAIEGRLISSIMIDASLEEFSENVRISRSVVDMARGSGILVEAELGKIKGEEDEISSDETYYTDPDEALEFVTTTGADLLAISIGTEHGVTKGRNLALRIDIAERVDAKLRDGGLDVPLVLHGSSGLLPEQVRAAIRGGIRKLNKDTHYQYAYGRAACEFYLEHAKAIIPPDGVEDDVFNLFPSGDWNPEKKAFDPRVVGRLIQERVKGVARFLLDQAGSGGHTLVRGSDA